MALPPGLYDSIVTEELQRQLLQQEGKTDVAPLEPDFAPTALARHVRDLIRYALKAVPAAGRKERQVDLVNRLVHVLMDELPDQFDEGDVVHAKVLSAIQSPSDNFSHSTLTVPGTPLSESNLLVNARGEFSVGSEIEKEILSSDRIDLLCSFIKWSGLRLYLPALRSFFQRGGSMRVITTTYIGATEEKALDALVELGADVKISFDTRRTRLHAKAWLFERNTGFTTAYIGSSNLSAPAQTEGLEWNVRISAIETPHLVEKFSATYESYWSDSEFETFDGSGASRARLRLELGNNRAGAPIDFSALDVHPYPFQQEILDALEVQRELRGRRRNLIVAATGTGKTVIAALDYRRLKAARKAETLLYVAHSKDILVQAQHVFRAVLKESTFGELMVDGLKPVEGRHIFASIQSLNMLPEADLETDRFDLVIVDESHHAAAVSYERLLNRIEPKYLLGLTATPERMDGRSILKWFDGHFASELRLWDAIDRGLLVPFHYFGVHDDTDLSNVGWSRNGYDVQALEQLYLKESRVAFILKELVDKAAAIDDLKALGFCVSIAHAVFMAEQFTACGIEAAYITGEMPKTKVEEIKVDLKRGALKVVFVVDLFNEGVDIPDVNTVLLLRPTESATLFLQQLGRGLRLSTGKPVLTVLDFIGTANRKFRFDLRFRALTGASRKGLKKQLTEGFRELPSGCAIHLDRQSSQIILENIEKSIGCDRRSLIEELRALGPETTLETYLNEIAWSVQDFYTGERSFSDLRAAAGFVHLTSAEYDLGSSLGRIVHFDDPERIDFGLALLADGAPPTDDVRSRRLWNMLAAGLAHDADIQGSSNRFKEILASEVLRSELQQLLQIRLDQVAQLPISTSLSPEIPLLLHASYTRNEIMAAVGAERNGALTQTREGVYLHSESGTYLMFVTIRKSEQHFRATTMYDDYAMSNDLFHWQSQNAAAPHTKNGQLLINHVQQGLKPLLFVRETRKDERRRTLPFVFLGPVTIDRYKGSKPMNIVWRMEQPMSAGQQRMFKIAA